MMVKLVKVLWFVLLYSWGSMPVMALQQLLPLHDYNRELWTTSHGLPHNTINYISQNDAGYLFFASWEGAVRFDGRRFELYQRSQLAGMADSGILVLEQLRSGAMLVGGSRGGLAILAGDHARLLPKVTAAINDLLEDRQGNLWISTEGSGLFRISPDGRQQQFNAELQLTSQITHELHQTADDRIWLGTSEGLFWFNPLLPTPRFHRIAPFAGMLVAALGETAAGELLVGTENGAFIYQQQQFKVLHPALSKMRVNAFLVDQDQSLWLGTIGHGVFRLSALGLENLNTDNGLPNNKIYSLFQDRERSVWIGTNAGLLQLRASPFRNLTTQQGLIDNYVRTLLVHSNGNIWVGTTAGLNRIVDGVIEHVQFSPALQAQAFRSLAEGPDGDVWVGTYADGVIRMRDGKEIARYNRSAGLGSNAVMSILPLPDGQVWLGTTGGLSLLKDGVIRTLHIKDGLPGEFINSLKLSPDRQLWIGTGFGPAVLRDGKLQAIDMTTLAGPQQVFDFHFEENSPQVWMATDRGLVRYQSASKQLAVVDSRHGLSVEKFFSIQVEMQSDAEYFWLSSNRGVSRLLKSDVEQVLNGHSDKLNRNELFGVREGMLNAQCNGGSMPSALRHPDGSFWFATAMGVAQISPADLSDYQPEPPPVVIQKMWLDGAQQHEANPVFAGFVHRVEFQYTGLSFLMPGRLLYRTRLAGFEQDWIDRGNLSRAEYTNLPPGDYQFQVMTTYPDHPWPAQITTQNFSIIPNWWQRKPLWLAASLLLALSLWLLYRLHMQRQQRKELYLQQQIAEKTVELQRQSTQLQQLVTDKSALVDQLQLQTLALEQQVRLDALTGIANRRAFDESLQYECLRSSRLLQPLSLVLIDLDHFKRVNDLYSHLAGDLVLKRVSALLRQQVRDIDTLARWGGEEFALLLPNTTLGASLEICERIRQHISQIDCQDIDPSMRLTASFGVANCAGQGQPRQLITQADAMLYLAKARGRDQVCG